MLGNSASCKHADMSAAVIGCQDRAGHVEAAESDGRGWMPSGVNKVLVGHAVRVLLNGETD